MAPEVLSHEFAALGTAVGVRIVSGRPDDAQRVERVLRRHGRALDRALPGSELNALNAAAPAATAVSPLLFDVISDALGWAYVTDGAFDPTCAAAPRASAGGGTRAAVADAPARDGGRWRDVSLDHERETVTLPAGVALDLDAIGIGHAVDRAVAALGPRADALVDVGGVLYAAGDGPHGEGWYIGVPHPRGPTGYAAVLNVNDRGVATADATGSPDALASVTVVAATATMAAVLAVTAARRPPREALRFVQRFSSASALALTREGGVLQTESASDYLA